MIFFIKYLLCRNVLYTLVKTSSTILSKRHLHSCENVIYTLVKTSSTLLSKRHLHSCQNVLYILVKTSSTLLSKRHLHSCQNVIYTLVKTSSTLRYQFSSNIFSFREIWLCLQYFERIGGRHFFSDCVRMRSLQLIF